MGAAPYGEPKYYDTILEHLVDLREDGSFKLDMKYFAYDYGLTMTNQRFEKLFGHPRREPESEMEEFHWDMAASVQKVTEEVVLRMARDLHARTGLKNLCMAGGVALNCVANGRIIREGPFENLWVQPAAGDAGGALGARALRRTLRPREPAQVPHGPRLLGPLLLRRGDPASSTPAARPTRRSPGTR